MKGHPRLGCLVPNLQSSPEQKDDETSFIPSTPSFVIPETGPFRRQNPNYVLPPSSPPSNEAPTVLSSASFTPTEPVSSVNAMKGTLPSYQQFTPDWSRPSSTQLHRRVLKAQSSVFGAQPGDSVRWVAGIYQIPTTTVESYRTRALSNGIYCVPIEGPLKGNIPEARMELDDELEPSTWIVTGSRYSDVDALVAILQPRGLVWRILHVWPTAIMQVVPIRDMDVLHYGALTLSVALLVYAFVYLQVVVIRWMAALYWK